LGCVEWRATEVSGFCRPSLRRGGRRTVVRLERGEARQPRDRSTLIAGSVDSSAFLALCERYFRSEVDRHDGGLYAVAMVWRRLAPGNRGPVVPGFALAWAGPQKSSVPARTSSLESAASHAEFRRRSGPWCLYFLPLPRSVLRISQCRGCTIGKFSANSDPSSPATFVFPRCRPSPRLHGQ